MNTRETNLKPFLLYIPFVLLFAIIFVWHLFLPTVCDDLQFSKVYHSQNIFSFLFSCYEDWSSRLLIDFFLVPLAGLPKIVWDFFDSIIFVLIAVLIPKIALGFGKIERKNLFIYNFLSCTLVLIYIFTISAGLASAGYIATTLNYIWPLFFALLHFYLVKEYLFADVFLSSKKKIIVYFLILFSLIFAINQELMLFVVSEAYIMIILYGLFKQTKIPNSIFIISLIILISYLNFYLCPGNHSRFFHEISVWFPDYNNLNLINKIDLGITILFNRIILPYGVINMIFFGALAMFTNSITKKKITLLISLIPLIITISLGFLVFVGYVPIVEFLNEGITRYGLLFSDSIHIFIISAIYVLITFAVLYCLIQMYSYGEKNLSLLILGLLILGVASQMMRGFSPTCWASAERWEIYYYFFITLVTYLLTVKLVEKHDNKG